MVERSLTLTPKAVPRTTLFEMEVIEHGESYEEIDGDFKFAGTLVVYREGGKIYHAVTELRCQSAADVKSFQTQS